eukprot:COSAG04_NODE_1633_length_6104_cov_3.956536_8_plen_225_part_00
MRRCPRWRRATRGCTYYVKELHTRFEGYECCIDASVARTAAHEDLKVLFAALAKNAGAIAVALEPRGWDEGGAYDKHKRPDIEWINAVSRRFTITDITTDWTMSVESVGDRTAHAEAAEGPKFGHNGCLNSNNRHHHVGHTTRPRSSPRLAHVVLRHAGGPHSTSGRPPAPNACTRPHGADEGVNNLSASKPVRYPASPPMARRAGSRPPSPRAAPTAAFSSVR